MLKLHFVFLVLLNIASTWYQARMEIEKRTKQVAKFDAYYRELKKNIDKREMERKAAQKTPDSSHGPSSPSRNSNENISRNATARSPPASEGAKSALPSPSFGSSPSSVATLPLASPPPLHPPMVMTGLSTRHHKNPTTSTLEASLLRSAALEKKDHRAGGARR